MQPASLYDALSKRSRLNKELAELWTSPRFHAEIPKSYLLWKLTVELLRNALSSFRKLESSPMAPLQMTDLDQRIGGSRSKRSQIQHVLRRYEQGVITQANAVEEILKLMR